jgi:hypothetical protein
MSNARLVILFLGALALASLGGIIYLVSADKSIPDILVATVSSSIAALGAILAKTSETTVTTPPPNPVVVSTPDA